MWVCPYFSMMRVEEPAITSCGMGIAKAVDCKARKLD